MTRQKDKKKAPSKSNETSIERGATALQNARYKDAIIFYKQLIKMEARDEWKYRLAKAYHGRACELGGKGMYEEALAVLANAISHDPSIDHFEELIQWSIGAGRYEAAVKKFLNVRNQLGKDELDRFESMFALAVVSSSDELAKFFPEDSKLRSHLPVIRQAIDAYCRGDDRTLAALLGQISFHSPYRDMRSILSALSTHASGATDAIERLSRISENSAFKPAARIVEQAISNPLDVRKLAQYSAQSRDFILTVQGIDSRSWDLAEKISKTPVSAKNLFNLLLNDPLFHVNRLVQELCYQLLAQYPYGIRAYEKKVKALEKFEFYRIHALALERGQDYDNATKAWAGAAHAMAQQDENRKNRLIRAMFLRRSAACAELGGDFLSIGARRLLEDSLKFDPDNLATYHRLFKIYKNANDHSHYECVERAVKRFPENSEVLLVAIEAAIERNTFKKAAKYAKTLLSLDPINQRARALLIKSHLSHAAKLIMQKKFELARKEIDAAEELEAANRLSGLIPLHRGLIEYAQSNEKQGEQMIDLACKMIGSYLRGYFNTAVEMIRLELSPLYRKKYLALLKNESQIPPDNASFLALIKEIQHISKQKDVEISTVMASVKKYLSAATSLNLSREEMEMVCDTFQSLEMYQQLMDFAAEAVKRWPDTPVFDYFLIYARSRGVAENMSVLDARRLEEAIDKADAQNNPRVANRLINYLENGIQPDFLDESIFPFKLDEAIEQFLSEHPDSEKLLDSRFGREDDNVPVKPRKSRRKSVR
ncbi:MAG: tetratricopeptide repeat protein [Methylococcales bacterium]